MSLPKMLSMLSVVLLAACAGSPQPRFFLLESIAPTGSAEGTGDALRSTWVVVDEVEVPGFLDRPELVIRNGSHRIDVSATDRWAESLGAMVQRVLIRNLGQRLPGVPVSSPRMLYSAGNGRVVVVRLDDFSADAGGGVTLDAVWTLLDADDESVLVRRRETVQLSAAPTTTDRVKALSRTLAVLADRLAAAMIGPR